MTHRAGRMAFLAIVVLTAAPPASGRGLLGHWRLDEAVGDVAKNALLAGRDGEIHGAKWVLGKEGSAPQFDGKTAYVALGDLGEFEAATIAFWVKPANVAAEGWRGTVSSDAWEAGVFHVPMRDGVVDVHLHLGGARRGRVQSSRLRNGVWYHVAVAADTRTKVLRLFTNGVEEDTADIAALTTGIKLVEMVVGREFRSRYFQGVIDDVRLYGVALDATEVRRLCPNAKPPRPRDPRDIRSGLVIPDEGYCDQPYVVVTKEGHWLCVLTTGPGHEGAARQHVVSTRSTDLGRTWSPLVDIEPGDGLPSAYVMPFITPSGRVYAFYDYNGDNFKCPARSDCVGWYVYRTSDDGGRSWSKQRHRLPMRMTAVDRTNTFGGKVQIFWGIGKPVRWRDSMIFAFSKCGKYLIDNSEGWFYRCDNLLTERDPAKLDWQLLPDGDVGLKNPAFGHVQAEQNIVALSDGSIYCMYRTVRGHPCHAYSRDGAHTWTLPEAAAYTPGGRVMKNPRACPRIWRCRNGRFLFWFHNHSGKTYEGRNPAWLSGGIERDGRIHWSQPEILLYGTDAKARMSYPDLIEQHGRTWVTETNKTLARVHEIDRTLLEGLWSQSEAKTVARKGLIVDLGPDQLRTKAIKPLPAVDLRDTGGLTLDLWVQLTDLSPGQPLVNTRLDDGPGLALVTADKGTVRLHLSDGKAKASWDCDPGLLRPGKLHHIVAIVDPGPRILTFLIDGQLCDGGPHRQYGWGRYPAPLANVAGSGKLRLARPPAINIRRLRIYNRMLRTSEAVANYHAGP